MDDQETLLENIATQLEFHFFMNGISLPEKRSWRGRAESLSSWINPDLTDLVTLSYVHSKLSSDPYLELYTKALDIFTLWGPSLRS